MDGRSANSVNHAARRGRPGRKPGRLRNSISPARRASPPWRPPQKA